MSREGSPPGALDPLEGALGEIRYAVRMIDGDPREGFVGLKERLSRAEEDIRQAKEERESFRYEQEIERARREGLLSSIHYAWAAISFIGGGGILAILGFIYHASTGGSLP